MILKLSTSGREITQYHTNDLNFKFTLNSYILTY